MTEAWRHVDEYFAERLLPPDPALDAALAASDAAGLPPHNVAPNQGALLQLIARMSNARTILEIGTLGGYSTIWLARALPSDGHLVSLEIDPTAANVAQSNIARAGLTDRVEIRLGPALESLSALEAEGFGPLDFAFIDADKRNGVAYLDATLRLSRPGTVIVADNVVRDGKVIDQGSDDPSVQGVRALMDRIASDPRLTATALQTVGSKGWDGFAIAIVNG